MCLFISVIRQDKFCENASNYVYWYASTGRCNKTECKGYYEVGYWNAGWSNGHSLWYHKERVFYWFCGGHQVWEIERKTCCKRYKSIGRYGCRCTDYFRFRTARIRFFCSCSWLWLHQFISITVVCSGRCSLWW